MVEAFNEEAFFGKIKAMMMLAVLFVVIGTTLQISAFSLEFNEFAPLLDNLKPLQKSVVDEADPSSEIAQWKTEAAKFPPKLMTFKLVGIGSILVGIFLTLFVIVQALKIMPVRLAILLSKKKK